MTARRCMDCERPAAEGLYHCCVRCHDVTEQGHDSATCRAYHTDQCNTLHQPKRPPASVEIAQRRASGLSLGQPKKGAANIRALNPPKAGLPNPEAQQHIGRLKVYAENMSEENWRDMRDRILAQLDALKSALASEGSCGPG